MLWTEVPSDELDKSKRLKDRQHLGVWDCCVQCSVWYRDMMLCFHNSWSSPYPLTCSWLTHISMSVCPVACQVNRYPHVNLLSGGDILR